MNNQEGINDFDTDFGFDIFETPDTPIEEEGLVQKIDEIELNGVSSEEMERLLEYKSQIESISDSADRDIIAKFYVDLNNYAFSLTKTYSDEDLKKKILFHFMAGSTVDPSGSSGIDSFDTTDGEMEDFLKERISQLESDIIDSNGRS